MKSRISSSFYLMISNCMLWLASICLLAGCGSKELSRSHATKLLSQHFQFPMPEYAEFSLIQGGIYHRHIGEELMKYQDAGLITYTQKKENFGAVKYTAQLTPEGYKHVLQDNGNVVVIKKAEFELGEIKGIISDIDQKRGYVEYTIRRVNITPWGKVLGLQEEVKNREDDFMLYDDGWRIMSNYEPPQFESPSKEDIDQRTSNNHPNQPAQDEEPHSTPPASGGEPGKFSGAWFEVKVPTGFQVIPSLKSKTAEGYESAFFRSPDNKVEFYIFSPQWNGTPSDIALNSSTEKQASSDTKSSGSDNITWYSIKANDNSYTRAYQDTQSKDGSVRWVVGIKYADQASYDRYKQQYLDFKKSLVQFAD